MSLLDIDLVVPAVCFALVIAIVGYEARKGERLLAAARDRLADEDRELLNLIDGRTPLWLELEQLAAWPHESSTSTTGALRAPAVGEVRSLPGGEGRRGP